MSASLHKETIKYSEYKSELQLPEIIRLIENDLSEPYSVYTYRYFIHNWPNLCFLVSFNGPSLGKLIFIFHPKGKRWRQLCRCDYLQARQTQGQT